MPGNIIHLTEEDMAAWPTPDYEDPKTRDYMPAFASIWLVAATIIVGLRFWIRLRRVGGQLGWDDLFLLIGWLTGLMFTVTAIMVSEDALAKRHFWDIYPHLYSRLAQLVWLGEFGYLLGSCMVRISVLLFYRRLVAGTYSKRWKIAVIGAIAFTSAWSLAFILALFLNCTPFEAYWMAFDPTYQRDFHCVDTSVINALSGAFAIPSDLYAVVLPWAMTWKLQMSRRQKIALNGVFSLGLVVVAACGVRTYFTIQVSKDADVSSAIFDVFVWAQVELQLAMMAASAPSLRVLFKHYLAPTLARSTDGVQENISHTGKGSMPSRAKSPSIVHRGGHIDSASYNSSGRDLQPLGQNKEKKGNVSPSVSEGESMFERSCSRNTSTEGRGARPWSPTQVDLEYEMQYIDKKARVLPPRQPSQERQRNGTAGQS